MLPLKETGYLALVKQSRHSYDAWIEGLEKPLPRTPFGAPIIEVIEPAPLRYRKFYTPIVFQGYPPEPVEVLEELYFEGKVYSVKIKFVVRIPCIIYERISRVCYVCE